MSRNTMSLISNISDLNDMIIEQTPTRDLLEGEVRLELDLFALTTNNISYAAFGESIGYWKLFPAKHKGFGHMPVWGFADIVESANDRIPKGARVWGFFPMASDLIVRPEAATKYSFVDGYEHRSAVPAIYNRYSFCQTNPYYRLELEALEALFRPLFITSYTATEFLVDNTFFSAQQLLISSASSKTAYGTAWRLNKRGVSIIGLTSASNLEFTRNLGVYDIVLTYDQIGTLDSEQLTLYIDLANDITLRDQVCTHFGSELVYQCLLGSTQSDHFATDSGLCGPSPVFFFAAEYLDLQREKGSIRYFMEKFQCDQLAFFEHADRPNTTWIELSESKGLSSAAKIIRELLNGQSTPLRGHTIRLR